MTRILQWILGTALIVAWGQAQAVNEYDMWRGGASAPYTLIMLDTSLRMSCQPGQVTPLEGMVACPYDTAGSSPYPLRSGAQDASMMHMAQDGVRRFVDGVDAAYGAPSPVLALATFGSDGAVMRRTFAPLDAGHVDTVQELVADLRPAGESALLPALLEAAHFLAGGPVLSGLARPARPDPAHPDARWMNEYQDFSPRWREQRLADALALDMSGLRRVQAAECRQALQATGLAGARDEACVDEYYSSDTPELIVSYDGSRLEACGADCLRGPDIVLVASRGAEIIGDFQQLFAGLPLGVWINRLLSGDPGAVGTHPQCQAQGADSAENCALQVAETLKQRLGVRISVVALEGESAFLRALAMAGGGSFRIAESAAALAGILLDETHAGTREILPAPVVPGSLAVMTADAGAGEKFFAAMVQASTGRRWSGNLKRYGLDGSVQPPLILSEQPLAGESRQAFDICPSGTGMCPRPDARSAWHSSAQADGAVVGRGGAASVASEPASRRVWVQSGQDMVAIRPMASPADIGALPPAQQAVLLRLARAHGWAGESISGDVNDLAMTRAWHDYNRLCGVDAGTRDQRWLAALTPSQSLLSARPDESTMWGASLWGAPVRVSYGAGQDVLWLGETEGFLRAVDAVSGETLSMVMPGAVLERWPRQRFGSPGDVWQGMDVQWLAWRQDNNHDGFIRASDGDRVFLYAAARRAGRFLLALDVTDPASPAVLFQIAGDQAEWARLGQAWSAPVLINARLPGAAVAEPLLVFGGGYDGRHDNAAPVTPVCPAVTNSCGAAVFFVHAAGERAGQLAWRIDSEGRELNATAHSDMRAPVVASLRALDPDGDGRTDMLYALDLDGQVFRIDLNDVAGAPPSLTVTTLARLGEAGADNAFFLPPSIALTLEPAGLHVTLALGSGSLVVPHRAAVSGRLWLLHDWPETASLPLTPAVAKRLPATGGNGPGDPEQVSGNTLWALNLPAAGEKLATPALIVDHKALFVTHAPGTASEVCVEGTTRLWAVDIRDARPVWNAQGEVATADAALYLYPHELAGGPVMLQALAGADNALNVMLGPDSLTVGSLPTALRKLNWQQILSGPAVKAL